MISELKSKSGRTFQNPVFDGYFADPFVFLYAGTYYAVATGPGKGGIFPMMTSEDLVHWSEAGAALIPPDSNLGTDFWAPEVAVTNEGFYLYYSVGFKDKQHKLRVAFSQTPTGPYTDFGISLVDPSHTPFAIDPSPFQDENGDWFLFYAKDFLNADGGNRAGTGIVVDRMIGMTQLANEPQVVVRATRDWQRYDEHRDIFGGTYDWHTLEGPCPAYRNGKYYCLYSGGSWQNESYGVDFVSAESITGPWVNTAEDQPRVLRTFPQKALGPGHNSLVSGPEESGDFIVYHAWDVDCTARRMCIDRLQWGPNGPVCNGPTWSQQSY